MGYVHPEHPDLFVSYALADDQLDPVRQDQWVSKLVEALGTRLKERLQEVDIWQDRTDLPGHVSLSGTIDRDVGRSAVFLAILSPRYLTSDWTAREREVFQRIVAEKNGDLFRVFLVERFKIDLDRRPREFGDRRGYRFWTPRKKDSRPLEIERDRDDYGEQLDDLVRDLAGKLDELRRARHGAEAAMPTPRQPARDATPVYLAEVTDDLEKARDGVRRHLEQQGLLVLPEGVYPRDPIAFESAAKKDLGRSKVFAQLLSETPGKRSPDLPRGYLGLQQDLAEAAGKPIFQWRSGFDPAGVEDAEHRARLLRTTVLAEGIEVFKARVVRAAKAEDRPPEPPPDVFVFVNAEHSDRPLAKELSEALARLGIEHDLPTPADGALELSRKELETYLEFCDTYFVVYGQTRSDWVAKQLLESRRIAAKRETPFQVVGVYDGPPSGKPEVSLNLRNLKVINCREGFDEAKLRDYFDAMRPGGRA